jgi:serine/threonine-protein kinase RIM15
MDTSEPQTKPIIPTVALLRVEDDSDHARRHKMERSVSQDIREEREDLKEAAEHSLNVILDLSLDGHTKWVSPSWQEVVGTPTESIIGKPIADIVIGDKEAFIAAADHLQKDDSRSIIVRFSTPIGKMSLLSPKTSRGSVDAATLEQKIPAEGQPEESEEAESEEPQHTIDLEAQGIVVYDRATGAVSHVSLARPV